MTTLSRRHAVTAVGAAAALAATATAGPAAAQSSGPSADQAAVTRAVDALSQAMIAVDKAKLEALTAPQLSYGHSAGRIENQKEFVDYLLSRQSAFRSINLSDQTVSVVENEAIVRHMMSGETQNPAGQVTPVRIGVLQVWQKQGNDWRLLARQAYRL